MQGLALTASGSYVNGIKAQRRAVELDDNFKEGWVHLAQVIYFISRNYTYRISSKFYTVSLVFGASWILMNVHTSGPILRRQLDLHY